MPLQVRNAAQLRQYAALAEAAGLEVTTPKRTKRLQRTPAQQRADLTRAIEQAKSELARRVLGRALGRMDQEAGRKLTS